MSEKLPILSIVTILASTSCALCQVLPFHNYTTRDGLPSNHVTALCQDSQGFLWIGTDEGVCVYDGQVFRTYTTVDGLVNPFITAIIESKNSPGTMWIASIAGGLTRYANGRFKTIPLGPHPPKTFIGTIIE